jgi:peptide/nickel transport system substrate-binding protein
MAFNMSFGLTYLVVILSCGLCWGLSNDDTIVVGKTFMASSTDPTSGSTAWALTSHGIAEKLFTLNQTGDIVGQVAESVSKVSDYVWDVTLKSGYQFSDGTEVNAEHVAECLNELNTLNPSAQASLDIMNVTAQSNLIVRIESTRQTHVMDSVLAEWVFVVYYHDGNDFVYTGPYIVEDFVDGDHIDLIPNSLYPQSDLRPMVQVRKYPDGYELAEAFEDLNVDVGFHLPIDTLDEVRSMDGADVKTFEVGYHYMMFYNTLKQMDDVIVRQAIDVAIDRNALVQALEGGHATRSLFPDYSAFFSDDSDTAGNKSKAEALLDEAGWTLSNSTRSKDGVELTIDLVAYPHRPGLVIMQPLIHDMLTALNITVNSILTGDDWDETQAIIDNGTFDVLMWAQNTLPAGDPAWFLSSFFRSDGGNNLAGFNSTEVDSLLDELAITEGHHNRVMATWTAQDAILEEVPVSNLATPSWHVGLSDRVGDYEPWGSDYYVIRADTFLAEDSDGDDTDGDDTDGDDTDGDDIDGDDTDGDDTDGDDTDGDDIDPASTLSYSLFVLLGVVLMCQ